MSAVEGVVVLWRHPYNGWLYGIPYAMRPGQSPTDIWRGPSVRVRSMVVRGDCMLVEDMNTGEVVPAEWKLIYERDPVVASMLRELEARDDWGGVPSQPYEWSRMPEVHDG